MANFYLETDKVCQCGHSSREHDLDDGGCNVRGGCFCQQYRIAELEAENKQLREALSDVRVALQEADGLTTKARNIARDALNKANTNLQEADK